MKKLQKARTVKRANNFDRTALVCATDLLARQDHSEARLRQKLKVRKYSEEDIDKAIDTLKKHNYLNDERACDYQFDIMYNSNKYSMKQIYAKLMSLGFEEQLINKYKPEDYEEHEEFTAVRLLKMKFKTPTEIKKMQQFLYTKGFDYSVISSSINQFKIDFVNVPNSVEGEI